MILQINFKSGKPVYLQLVDQIKSAAATGILRPGEALPSIRPLAEELRVNRNTVAKAYTELETQGIIENLAGKGCFVKENGSPLKKDVRRKLLTQEVDQVVIQSYHLQVPRPEFVDLVNERLDHLEEQIRSNTPQETR
jgi:GntR family transcriptional regulator